MGGGEAFLGGKVGFGREGNMFIFSFVLLWEFDFRGGGNGLFFFLFIFFHS